MTKLAIDDNKVICRIRLSGEGRWVSVALSLGDPSSTRLLSIGERLAYEIEGVDEAAQKYDLSNWQGGIISGARHAFRTLKVPTRQICLHELRGQLDSADVWAVSSAAALAVAKLLNRPAEFPLELCGWTWEEMNYSDQSFVEESALDSNSTHNQPGDKIFTTGFNLLQSLKEDTTVT